MLTDVFIDESIAAAEQLRALNKSITGAPGSPVERLNHICDHTGGVMLATAIDQKEEGTQEYNDELKELLRFITTPTLNEENASSGYLGNHTELLQSLVDQNKKGLITISRVVRDHVIPLIKDLHDSVKEGLEANSVGITNSYNVVPSTAPELLVTSSFTNLLAPYARLVLPNSLTAGCYLADKSDAEIVELIKTGSTTIDSLVEQLLIQHPNALRTVWDGLFLDVSLYRGEVRGEDRIKELLYRHPDRSVHLVLTFLLACAVINTPRDNLLINSSGNEINVITTSQLKATELRDLSGKELSTLANVFSTNAENDILVTGFVGNEVHVDSQMYKDFLDAGGTNEMLLGAMVNKTRYYRSKEILSKGNELEAMWLRHLSLIMQKDKNNETIHKRRLTAEVFNRQIREAIQNEGSGTSLHASQMAVVFGKVYDGLTQYELENFYLACTKLICRTRFNDPVFELIITDMFNLSRSNPDLSVNDVATLAFINYIGKWLADQLVLIRKR